MCPMLQRAREQVDIGQLEVMKTAPPGQKLHGAQPFIRHLHKGSKVVHRFLSVQ